MYDNQGGQKFKQLIKDKNNRYKVYITLYSKYLSMNIYNSFNNTEGGKIYSPGSIICNYQKCNYIISQNSIQFYYFEQIGDLNQPDDFEAYYQSLKYYEEDEDELYLLLENEEEKSTALKKPQRTKKTALKRQQITKILKRTIKMKTENFWKNFGWKLLKSLLS